MTGNLGTHLCGFCAADTSANEPHTDECARTRQAPTCVCCGCNIPPGSAIAYCNPCNYDRCLDENGYPQHRRRTP